MKPLGLSLKPGLLAAIGAVSLTACAGGITVSRENVAQSYLPEELYPCQEIFLLSGCWT